MKIDYQREDDLSEDEFVSILHQSGLAERRPVDQPDVIRRMLQHADLIMTARHEGALVGVARSVSDFAYCVYLSDLAVARSYQRQGIGRSLIEHTYEVTKGTATLILLAAPKAREYYPHIGMTHHDSCWVIRPSQ